MKCKVCDGPGERLSETVVVHKELGGTWEPVQHAFTMRKVVFNNVVHEPEEKVAEVPLVTQVKVEVMESD